jgi:hypothetical protein
MDQIISVINKYGMLLPSSKLLQFGLPGKIYSFS